MSKYTIEDFINKAREVHGDKYDYSKVLYLNANTKVIITCPIHGDFELTPGSHLYGRGCPECGKVLKKNKRKYNTKIFIEKSKEVHGDRYDYSKVEYIDSLTKVCIICPKHGEFLQKPVRHLLGDNCPECGKEVRIKALKASLDKPRKITKTKKLGASKLLEHQSKFIEKAKEIHGNKYDYSKVNYKRTDEKVCIICPEHGEFWQRPSDHILGHGCPKCKSDEARKTADTKEEFIEKAQKVHRDKYDYSKVNYVNSLTKVCIICPIHGEFWLKPNAHLNGNGCPKCNQSHGERLVEEYLINNNIKYISQYKIEINKSINSSGFAYIDFYLPDHNIFIEYNGRQHYESIDYFGGDEYLKHQCERDLYIRNYCKENNIMLIEIAYNKTEDEIKNILVGNIMGV